MSWLETGADGIHGTTNAVGEFVSDLIETAGNGLQDAFTHLGKLIPVVGIGMEWLGGVFSNVFDIAGVTLKSILGVCGGILAGILLMLGGTFTWNGKRFLRGLGDLLFPVVGAVIMIVVKTLGLVQHIVMAQAMERRLTKSERAVLKNAFGKSVGWYNVRLVEGRSGLLGINSRPLCLGNTIYLKSSYANYLASGNQSAALALLVHESTHVWQYQNAGVRYVAEALFAQAFVSNEYSWKKEVDDRKRVHWLEFNREAQASFVEDLYLSKTGAYAALTTETRRVVQEEASQRLTAIA